MINEPRTDYVMDCPVCGVRVSQGRIKLGVPQRMENKTCKNGHTFATVIGGAGCTTYRLEYREIETPL